MYYQHKRAPKTDPLPRRSNKPLIYSTDIPDKIISMLNTHDTIIVCLPTGYGKTVAISNIIADHKSTSMTLMPYRVSVKEMCKFLNNTFNNSFGYAMRDDSNLNSDNNCVLMTVGYWIEHILMLIRHNKIKDEPMIFFLDEAHASQWQTDYARRLIQYLQRTYSQVKLIMSSATLDIQNMTIPVNAGIITDDTITANVEKIFLDKHINPIYNGKMSSDLYDEIVTTTKNISNTANILIIMPGMEEINSLINVFVKLHQFDTYEIFALHSQLDKTEIDEVLNYPKKKIIVSTNIVENAITINNLDVVIISGLHKINNTDRNNCSKITLKQVSKSNIDQASGRVGRQGKRGKSYIMLHPEQYEVLKGFNDNEVQSNPLYYQIFKTINSKISVYDIFADIPIDRIKSDIQYLIDWDAIIENDGKYLVTDLGKIMSVIPLSIRTARFVAMSIKNCDEKYIYDICLIAAWLETSTSVFYQPNKKARENGDLYNDKISALKDRQKDFLKNDCLTTFLNVWYESWNYDENISFNKWCFENGIYNKTITSIKKLTDSIVVSLEKLGYYIVSNHDAYDKTTISLLKKLVIESFNDKIYANIRNNIYTKQNDVTKYVTDKKLSYGILFANILGLETFQAGNIVVIKKYIGIELEK
jgi:HrpA-like RNA helicase